MTEDSFQNQAFSINPDFVFHPIEGTTLTSATNNMMDETYGIFSNPAHTDSTTYNGYGNEPMAFNATMDGFTASTNFDNISGQLFPCDFEFGEPITEVESHISPNSTPLMLSLATSTGTFDLEPTTKEFKTWKENWNEKIQLLSWKREGKSWEDITAICEKMSNLEAQSRKSALGRAKTEVSSIDHEILDIRANLPYCTGRSPPQSI
jgi:hypothetical protein